MTLRYETILYRGEGKRKVSPCLCYEGIQGEQRYKTTIYNQGAE